MRLFIRYIIIILIGLNSCKVSQPPAVPVATTSPKIVQTDSIAEQSAYDFKPVLFRGEQTRHFRLIHTKLEVSFDWVQQQLHGDAHLILQPYFYDQTELTLDAKDFDIHDVVILKGSIRILPKYDYDGRKIRIDLGETYDKTQNLHIEIKYTANPNESQDSAGLDNDKKGLYFINPQGDIPGKPRQLWTQGETSTNSKWFPTIDNPNQKSTQEIFITVDDEFTTLSNGKLVYTQTNADGTRTDYWKMDQPHAPYLFMMAVGDFKIVEDKWNDINVDYYLEPEFAKYGSNIFGNTPEMIEYFSRILNYPFPWDKYSQVVVRDFVSGAMENTTASVFMEDLNVNSRELIDYNWDDIIAHELIHQWFGDLVTCESWANLPLNESFATYGEYLWKNYKYGKDEADFHLWEELQTYLHEAEEKQVDLIRYHYDHEDDMFDSHSYAKGGLILHLLRNYVGDEAFFAALEYYLKSHAYGKAEAHELRLAFEQVSGEDLNWFFNQWFFDAGHPVLKIEEDHDSNAETLKIKVWQEQDTDLFPIFKLPLTLDVWQKGTKTQYLIEIDKPYQEFDFENIVSPDMVLLDSDHVLVGEINHQKTLKQWKFQYDHYENSVRSRYIAFTNLKDKIEDPISAEVVKGALLDDFWGIREEALMIIEGDTTGLFSDVEESIVIMAKEDSSSLVRAQAIAVLNTHSGVEYIEIYRAGLYDSSYTVAGSALYAYLQTEPEDASSLVQSLKDENNFNISSSIADYYISHEDHEQYAWFAEKLHKYRGSDLWYFIKLFGMYLFAGPEQMLDQGIEELLFIAGHHNEYYNRLSAYQTLQYFIDVEGVAEKVAVIRENEKDPRILPFLR
jgi:aminopeptidase N